LFLLYLLIILVMTNKTIFEDYFINFIDLVICNLCNSNTITVNTISNYIQLVQARYNFMSNKPKGFYTCML